MHRAYRDVELWIRVIRRWRKERAVDGHARTLKKEIDYKLITVKNREIVERLNDMEGSHCICCVLDLDETDR